MQMMEQVNEQGGHLEHQLNVVGRGASLVPRNRLVVEAPVTHVVQENRIPCQNMHGSYPKENALGQRQGGRESERESESY